MRLTQLPVAPYAADAALEETKPKRMNFVAPSGLIRRVKLLAEEHHQSQSDVIRRALELFVEMYEKEKTARAIEEACEFYYALDKQAAAVWRAAEPKI